MIANCCLGDIDLPLIPEHFKKRHPDSMSVIRTNIAISGINQTLESGYILVPARC